MEQHVLYGMVDIYQGPPAEPTLDEGRALQRLIAIAKRDSGQCKRVADFLLAWWNAESCGGFDLTDAWAVDKAIMQDMVVVFGMIARINKYPPELHPSLEPEFKDILHRWRPDLMRDESL
ncbi:hypothetical protein ACMHYO_11735 [Allopusillimonas ginsengisoli]|uniref:DUF7673 family protein n=1 Tax=Allopusillimonas ginsengisoli TaxID=453575 RepID=UPI0039C2E4D0